MSQLAGTQDYGCAWSSPSNVGKLLLRAIVLALAPRRLILGALTVFLLHFGTSTIERSLDVTPLRDPFAFGVSPNPTTMPWNDALREAAQRAIEPFVWVVEPLGRFFSAGTSWRSRLESGLLGVWALAVLAFLGGAIGRSSASELAQGKAIGAYASVRFCARRLHRLIGSVLSPIIGIGFLAGFCAVFGLMYRLPGPAGQMLGGLFFGVALLLAIPMTWLAVGWVLDWPLMVLAIVADEADIFEAVSRSYAYVFRRLLSFVALVVIAFVLVAVGSMLVAAAARWILGFAAWGASLGAPRDAVAALVAAIDSASISESTDALTWFWIKVVSAFANGWVLSAQWSLVAAIYLILRNRVDGTPLDEFGAQAPASST